MDVTGFKETVVEQHEKNQNFSGILFVRLEAEENVGTWNSLMFRRVDKHLFVLTFLFSRIHKKNAQE